MGASVSALVTAAEARGRGVRRVTFSMGGAEAHEVANPAVVRRGRESAQGGGGG